MKQRRSGFSVCVDDVAHATLPGGRLLAYAEYGDPTGPATFFFRGWPGSRLDFAPNGDAARRAGVRVIAVDRPGIGLSDHSPGRMLLDWPGDVSKLADALGIERFSVCGFSFDGPYVRACAYKLPDRVTRAGLISCLGAVESGGATRGMPAATKLMLAASRRALWLARAMVALTARQAVRGKARPAVGEGDGGPGR